MLVLSRRPSEKIVFPNLGITIEVLQTGSKLTRLGISAPDSVRILRSEVAEQSFHDFAADQPEARRPRSGGRLEHIVGRLHAIRRQLENGVSFQAATSLSEVLSELQQLDSEQPRDTSPTPLADADRMRLLVVEDDANERELLAGLLQLHGFQVDTAVDGADALQYLSTHQVPDCVLLDLDMPQVDGHRTILSIRGDNRFRHARVFAVSGQQPSEKTTPAGLRGFDGWFPKPLDPSKLLRAICARGRSAALRLPELTGPGTNI